MKGYRVGSEHPAARRDIEPGDVVAYKLWAGVRLVVVDVDRQRGVAECLTEGRSKVAAKLADLVRVQAA